MSEQTILLPRLALSYYLLIAAGLCAGGFIAWFFLRRYPAAASILSKVWIYGLVYIVSSLCVKGLSFPTFELTYDLCRILLLSLPIYITALSIYDAFMRKAEKRQADRT